MQKKTHLGANLAGLIERKAAAYMGQAQSVEGKAGMGLLGLGAHLEVARVRGAVNASVDRVILLSNRGDNGTWRRQEFRRAWTLGRGEAM